MIEQIVEVEAESLEEARAQLKSQIPEGFHLLSEQVISDGKPQTVKVTADTTEAAFAQAQTFIPVGAAILEKKELSAPEQKVITVEANDENSVEMSAKRTYQTREASFKNIRLITPGRKGFLGIGKKSNQYEVQVLQPAVVSLTYKTKAKLSAVIIKANTATAQWLVEKARMERSRRRNEKPQERERWLEAEAWVQRLQEARDWRALTAVFDITPSTGDFSEVVDKDKYRYCAQKVLVQAEGEAVDAVIEKLSQDQGKVYTSDLVEILTIIGDERAAKPLLREFKGLFPSDLKYKVIDFFVRIRAIEVVQDLVSSLKVGRPDRLSLGWSNDRSTRQAAAYGLGLLGLPETVPALQAALEEYSSPIQYGLKKAGTEFAQSLIEQWDAKRKATGPNVEKMTDQEMLQILRQLCQAYNEDSVSIAVDKLQPLARDIGKELNRRGGTNEMLRVFRQLGGIRGSRTLEMLWDGIGDWQS